MKILFVGWCNDPNNNHDKVWGIGDQGNGQYVTFWGRRGKKLQSAKKVMTEPKALSLISSKKRKGYVEVPADEMSEVHEQLPKDLFKLVLGI